LNDVRWYHIGLPVSMLKWAIGEFRDDEIQE
jgi:hypothetical protein